LVDASRGLFLKDLVFRQGKGPFPKGQGDAVSLFFFDVESSIVNLFTALAVRISAEKMAFILMGMLTKVLMPIVKEAS